MTSSSSSSSSFKCPLHTTVETWADVVWHGGCATTRKTFAQHTLTPATATAALAGDPGSRHSPRLTFHEVTRECRGFPHVHDIHDVHQSAKSSVRTVRADRRNHDEYSLIVKERMPLPPRRSSRLRYIVNSTDDKVNNIFVLCSRPMEDLGDSRLEQISQFAAQNLA
jgi:hypothetical protein